MSFCSPKRATGGSQQNYEWYDYYAGYSPEFVRDIIRELKLEKDGLLLDPWNGSGTTTKVAYELGYASAGYDLNPVMVIVAKSRLLPASVKESLPSLSREIIRHAVRISWTQDIHLSSGAQQEEPLTIWLHPTSAHHLRILEQSVRYILIDEHAEYLSRRNDLSSVSSLAAFFYVALFRTVRDLVRPFKASNPTWIKEPECEKDRVGPTQADIYLLFRKHVKAMTAEVAANGVGIESGSFPICSLNVASSTEIPMRDNSVQGVVASPPYCTRIDYCIATKPELAILGFSMNTQLDQLRNGMIGTPTITGTPIEVQDVWGETCNAFLAEVENHATKASKSYYLKTFVQYYDSLYASLREIDRTLRHGGKVVLVVQDSYYKDVHNDLPGITSEMANTVGWRQIKRVDFSTERTMGAINNRSRPYRSESSATESVLIFKKGRDGQHGSSVVN